MLGGDGTILQAFAGIDGRIPPTFGINLGSLGFLTCIGAAGWHQAVEVIVSGDYVPERAHAARRWKCGGRRAPAAAGARSMTP